eukprot:Plantae.Rhodophyta-Hildenbrandia_rubra.ctg4577.p2 GENE.Plantae.Rhodophyta-Hildenbrandia_rubra.ctg4577~~Plantae.Rhodophyta-Hildenbrandia_rubra.ctg4577.p2  ORF type:complete len:231 (-),score=61.96 Plantae.Rhodophyta-Hildenbrandia_rubra.ctg4577:248-940(-)
MEFVSAIFGGKPFEQRDYTVLHRRPGYEIRRYTPCVTASVSSTDISDEELSDKSDSRAFGNIAFKKLARYIGVIGKPENTGRGDGEGVGEKVSMTAPVNVKKEEKVSMTVPVRVGDGADGGDGVLSMAFYLPKKYSKKEEAPVPKDSAVKIADVDSKVEAVMTFSWNVSLDNCGDKVEKLKGLLEKDGLKPSGKWSLNRMNPPFCVPFLKTNELSFPLDREQVDKLKVDN